MTNRSRIAWTVSCALLAAACSGATDSQLGQSGGNPAGGSGSSKSYGNLSDNIGPGGTSSACVSSTASATLANVDLVVMVDKSGSMGDRAEGFDPALKWTPVTAAMKAFFSDPKSAGIAASLQFFPQGTVLGSVCDYPYGAPLVPLTPLTNGMSLDGAIDATQPAGGTPTLPALNGAVAYAHQTAQAHPLDKVVVVLATDGDPGFGINGQFTPGCADNDIPHVAAAAQAALGSTPPLPTYVIGVGPDLQNLDAIAMAGGTKQAIMVPVNDPMQTEVAFRAALETIRAASVPCELSIPQPPSGALINPNSVNVVLVTGTGQQQVLAYSDACSNSGGWHYDNVASPTLVELCTSACSEAQRDAAGHVTLAFGCLTSGFTH